MRVLFDVLYLGAWIGLGLMALAFVALVTAFVVADRHERRKGFIPTNPPPPSRWRGHQAKPPHPGIW